MNGHLLERAVVTRQAPAAGVSVPHRLVGYPATRSNDRYNGTLPAMLLRKAFLIFGANLLLLSAPLPLFDEQAAKSEPRAGRVQFIEVAAESGITFRHE